MNLVYRNRKQREKAMTVTGPMLRKKTRILFLLDVEKLVKSVKWW